MISERSMELINADIDGELSQAEQSELEAVLESSSEARAMNAELLKLNNLMSSLPDEQPPQDLNSQILQNIKLPSQRSPFSLAGLLSSFQPATAGLAFAAGLLLTVGFYELSSDRLGPGDSASMVGTMVAGQGGGPEFMKNDMKLKGDGFSGTISLRESAGLYVLNFDLDSENRTEVEVGLDGTGFAFGGFAEVQGDANKVFESVTMSGGALRVVNQGHQQFAVFLREDGAGKSAQSESISIDFSSTDQL
jgi:hypothetical protein